MRRTKTLLKLCRAKDFIRDAFAEPIDLADVACEAELSPWHLLRQFRQTFGETPHEFLTRVRLDKAKRLLALGDRSVTDICFDVGFSSLGSFSTLFARKVGLSPCRFRRHARSLVTVPAALPWLYVPCCFALVYGGPTHLLGAKPAR
jgi:AraC-like DNA-binding protein